LFLALLEISKLAIRRLEKALCKEQRSPFPLLFSFFLHSAVDVSKKKRYYRNDMQTPYALGFQSLAKEVRIDKLSTRGVVPSWLTGTLVRNGPAKFEVGERKLRHWFDGFAMLHKFSFHDGEVSYANKFLETEAYRYAKANGKIGYSEFATDPCRSIFKRFAQMFSSRVTDNANVNISKIANRFVALTEIPLPIEFDPATLETTGVLRYDDHLKGQLTTAHPHYDVEKQEAINYVTRFGRSSSYSAYRIPSGSQKRELIGSVSAEEPSYMHSFSLTEHYVVLTAYPFVVNPLRLLLTSKPFIENFAWKPERGTKFFVIDRKTGALAATCLAPSFFSFHHVNAFEEGGEIIVDFVAYPDSSVVQSLYLDVLRGDVGQFSPIPAELRRYRVSLKDASVHFEALSSQPIELPRTNYRYANAKPYRFVYGTGSQKGNPKDFLSRLVKMDVHEGKSRVWHEEDCYPGEPVFVALPKGVKEDDGIILSVVLNAEKKNSFLLILDAKSFDEIARAEVPHHIPFGFHGQYM